MKRISILSLMLVSFVLSVPVFANMTYFKAFKAAYPNATTLAKCKVCHDGAPPKLNYYGQDLQKANYDFKAIEALDSDGDTVNNLDEINKGTWPGFKED